MLMSRSCGVMAMVATSLVISSIGFCQQDFIFKVVPDDQAKENVKRMVEAENKAATIRLRSMVAAIHRACDLSKDQQSKLEVAIKGVTKDRYEPRFDELLALVRRTAAQNPNTQVLLSTMAPREFDADENWISALESVLTEEQRIIYETWQNKRQQLLKTAVINQFIGEIDIHLLLSPEQRERLTAIVDEKFGDLLLKQFVDELRDGIYRHVHKVPAPRYLHLVEDVLSEDQLEEWKRTVEHRLQQLR